MKQSVEEHDKKAMFLRGVIAGIGWALGVTIGFVLVSTVLAFLLKNAGGLPLIGDWIANIVESTIEQLSRRAPVLPQ